MKDDAPSLPPLDADAGSNSQSPTSKPPDAQNVSGTKMPAAPTDHQQRAQLAGPRGASLARAALPFVVTATLGLYLGFVVRDLTRDDPPAKSPTPPSTTPVVAPPSALSRPETPPENGVSPEEAPLSAPRPSAPLPESDRWRLFDELVAVHLRFDRFDEARVLLDEALTECQEGSFEQNALTISLARVELAAKTPDRAQATLRPLLERVLDEAQRSAVIDVLFSSADTPELAARALTDAARLFPKDANTGEQAAYHRRAAAVAQRAVNANLVLAHAQRWLAAESDFVQAQEAVTMIERLLSDPEARAQVVKNTLRQVAKNPDDHNHRLLLARLTALDDPHAAARHYRELLALRPDDRWVRTGLFETQIRDAAWNDVIALARDELQRPNLSAAERGQIVAPLCRALLQTGKQEEAERLFAETLALQPANTPSWDLLLRHMTAGLDATKTFSAFEQRFGAPTAPDHQIAALVQIARDLHQDAEAETRFARMLVERDGGNMDRHLQLARALRRVGTVETLDQAAVAYQDAVRIAGLSARTLPIHLELLDLLITQRKGEDAQALAQRLRQEVADESFHRWLDEQLARLQS